MANLNDKYETVIGLEVHAQLSTASKLFCGDSAAFGAEPNTHVSPITLGHPGTLPKTNKKAVEYAVRMGIACNCTLAPFTYFSRKNYFYPDLPKGYQISQNIHPICDGGYVSIHTTQGNKNVQLNHIHLEDDAGKSVHDISALYTGIDLNRAGVPLIEIVSEPDMHSGEEAFEYVSELRRLVRWIGICDGNMEEGSLRCDANVSIRLKGETRLGTKVEVKNINSIRNVKRAIEFEIQRMTQLAEEGKSIIQQTRSFNAEDGTTFAMRDKEEANDYRYFPEPDLPPVVLTAEYISHIKEKMPTLPQKLEEILQAKYQLGSYDAAQLCMEKDIADYFLEACRYTQNYKAAANWINGPLRQIAKESENGFASLPLKPSILAELITLIEEGQLNFSIASSRILPLLLENSNSHPLDIARSQNLLQVGDTGELEIWVKETLEAMPDKVKAYKNGKKGLIGLFVGQVKKRSKGKADPQKVMQLLKEKLEE